MKHKFPKHPIGYLINRLQLWNRAAVVVWWRQDGNTITLKTQRCGLFRDYYGIPFVTTIEIDPTLVDQSRIHVSQE